MTEPETTRFLDALHHLMHAFDEVQADAAAKHLGPEMDDDDEIEITPEQDAAIDGDIAGRVRDAVAAMLKSEHIESGEVAALISYLNDALMEIDPTLFTPDEEDEK